MIKRFVKESKTIKNILYYFHKMLNGEIGYILVSNKNLSGEIVIDLEMERGFTGASALKQLLWNKEEEVCQGVGLRRENFYLKFVHKNPNNNFKIKMPFVQEELLKMNLNKGDVFIYQKNGSDVLGIAFTENNEIKDKIKVGSVINLKGYAFLKESEKMEQIEDLVIEEFCSLRKKSLIRLLIFYVFLNIFGFFYVHFYYKDFLSLPLKPMLGKKN